ncbi:MAG: hypothetical protein RR888_09090, partial [Akkermansia sp.]
MSDQSIRNILSLIKQKDKKKLIINTNSGSTVSPTLGLRWEADATLRFAPLTQHVLSQTPSLLH